VNEEMYRHPVDQDGKLTQKTQGPNLAGPAAAQNTRDHITRLTDEVASLQRENKRLAKTLRQVTDEIRKIRAELIAQSIELDNKIGRRE